MGIAALDIFGGLLAFGAIVLTFGLFSGNFPVKFFDFVLLVGILIVATRLSFSSFQPPIITGTFIASRIIAGSYSVLLAFAALFLMVQLFISR
jgi:hypothetical protein